MLSLLGVGMVLYNDYFDILVRSSEDLIAKLIWALTQSSWLFRFRVYFYFLFYIQNKTLNPRWPQMQSIRYSSAVHRILSPFLSIFANRRRVHSHRRARVYIRVLFAAVSVNCFTYFVYIICYSDGGICFIYTYT